MRSTVDPQSGDVTPHHRHTHARSGRALPVATLVAAAGLLTAFAAVIAQPAAAPRADQQREVFGKSYGEQIRPLIKRYCQDCHGDDLAEADLNLEPMETLADVRKHLRQWQKVGEMLESGQMPPKAADQPTDAERATLQKWVRGYLTLEAQANAGDPGRVVLRRLSNSEYTYTIRDLTGVDSLDPAREFPVDGAAGEGFTNTGNALVMSPTLVTKYLDAAKEVADHAVLLPDGIRFSPHTTRRDWTDDLLGEIRGMYREFSDASGGTTVNLQGLVWDTNQGGRLPLEKYLSVTLEERDALKSGNKTIAAVAQQHGVNPKYLGLLWSALTSEKPSLLLDGLRARWQAAKPADAAALANNIAAWQAVLWKFTTVGHIGKVGGPKAWLEPVSPLVSRQELRFPLPAAQDSGDIFLSLVAAEASGKPGTDHVLWQQPRLVAAGKPDLLLRDVRAVYSDLAARREKMLEQIPQYLAAAAEADATPGDLDLPQLARKHGVQQTELRAWLDYLGIGAGGAARIENYLKTKVQKGSGYDFINGWATNDLPSLVTNSSDQHVRIPGNMKPHSVAVHPTPTLRVVVGWRSPVATHLNVEAQITHAHPECGNGVAWTLELRRGATRQRLASGIAHGGNVGKTGPLTNIGVRPGDLISLAISPRDGNHSCDLTALDWKLTETKDQGQTWDLAGDISGDILAGNPHADRAGHADVWHFYSEPVEVGKETGPVIPANSLLAQWQAESKPEAKQKLASAVQQMLQAPAPAKDSPDGQLHEQLTSLGGPLFSFVLAYRDASAQPAAMRDVGPDPALFGKHPSGKPIDAGSLCVVAPKITTIQLPAELVAGRELVTTGLLDSESADAGSVQLQVVAGVLDQIPALQPGQPILVAADSEASRRVEAGLSEFRDLFPAALCYTKIVPVDEVVTLSLFYREDNHLVRLMLDEAQTARLDKLWNEMHFVAQDALTLVNAYDQLMEFATQDADPSVFEPLRKPIYDRAAAFRQQMLDTQPKQVQAVLDFAALAYRRPLTEPEGQDLQKLYRQFREEGLSHEDAVRLLIARVLVSPAFLYRVEQPGPGTKPQPVNDWELASRLSYFLWSSQPDARLRELAAQGKLHETETLVAETRRMLQDPRVRRLATEFACQWLHIHDFDHLDEKSERHFPNFLALRGDMYEESRQFFTDLFQHDGTVLDILDSDHTFLNEALAQHYGIPNVTGPEWRKVTGIRQYGRGGILGQATTLAKQSGASRTSPILRGNWISEVLLGERLPRPPKDVPQLPDDEAATAGLTVRQLVEKHSSDPKCSVCHRKIDPYGFALEKFDAIGARREKDLGDRLIDTKTKTLDGVELEGIEGLRNYLLTVRGEAFLRQFCKKLLGFALGRAVQLTDEPLLAQMQADLKAHDYKLSVAIEAIVRSRQFREIRGQAVADDE